MLSILTDNTKILKTILILGILTDKFKHKCYICNWGKVCHTICIKTLKKIDRILNIQEQLTS